MDGRADRDRGLALPARAAAPAAAVGIGDAALAAAAAFVVVVVVAVTPAPFAASPHRQRLDRGHHLVRVHRVEARRGLVEKEHARVSHKRDADVDSPGAVL